MFKPPDHVRGMISLDKSKFDKQIKLPFIQVDTKSVNKVLTIIKPLDAMLKIRNFKTVCQSEDQEKTKIYLNPETIKTLDDLKDKRKPLEELFDVKTVDFQDFQMKYEYYSYAQILDSILPENQETISSFSLIGHIVHLNLKEHNLPYKYLIGQVILDKLRQAKLVVNKLNIIESEFRNFNMEVLAKSSPEIDSLVKTSEKGVKFEFDFAKVYWNPRLGTERERIVKIFKSKVDVLYDVFAGVGPFALAAAAIRRCQVVANDLNPECYKWLTHNIKLNKVEHLVKPYNLDGREFIKTILRKDYLDRINSLKIGQSNQDDIPKFHIVMNLPALAVEFLDAFKGLFTENQIVSPKLLPIIHCYCFVKGEPENHDEYIKGLIQQVIGQPIQNENVHDIVNVRHVAPNKDMFRISFIPPLSVLCSEHLTCKRQRVE